MELSVSLFVRKHHAVIDIAFAFGNGTQLALQQGLAQRCDIVDKHMALQVFILMLDDASADAFKHILVFLKVFVEIFDSDFAWTLLGRLRHPSLNGSISSEVSKISALMNACLKSFASG